MIKINLFNIFLFKIINKLEILIIKLKIFFSFLSIINKITSYQNKIVFDNKFLF